MTLNQEQIDQNTQATVNDIRSHCHTGSAIGLAATELLGKIDAYILVGQKKGYFLGGDRVITNESRARKGFLPCLAFRRAATGFWSLDQIGRISQSHQIYPLIAQSQCG